MSWGAGEALSRAGEALSRAGEALSGGSLAGDEGSGDKGFSPGWLALREPADAAARAVDLFGQVRAHLAGRPEAVLCDLGSGTGSMGRWLARRLPGRQRWVMYDRDADLLARAQASMVCSAADGAPVTTEARRRDISGLTAADLAGASLVTASALLDILTAEELDRVVAACVGAGCAVWLTLSVTGRVELTPPDPLDEPLAEAFNAHQRRTAGGRRLLGPDAVGAAAAAFERRGMTVTIRPSPWRLGPERAALATAWLRGWVGAACEQRPELAELTSAYRRWRLAEAAAGRLGVVVGHSDLWVRCG